VLTVLEVSTVSSVLARFAEISLLFGIDMFPMATTCDKRSLQTTTYINDLFLVTEKSTRHSFPAVLYLSSEAFKKSRHD